MYVLKKINRHIFSSDELNQSLNSPVNSQAQFTTTQTTSPTNSTFSKKNLNQLKPIDSVDSVSGLLDGTTQAEATGPSKAYSSQNKKFSNILESEFDSRSSSPQKNVSNNDKKSFDYNNIKNDNDNVNTSKSISTNNRPPITPIIKHYEKSNSNSPLSHNFISMKLEPHPTSYLKSFENFKDQNDPINHPSSTTNNIASIQSNRTNENQKFNGKFF